MAYESEFLKQHRGEKCGRCGYTVGDLERTRDTLRIVHDAAVKREAAASNYVANAEVSPTRVLFANGRTVRVVRGILVIGWARKEARRVFAVAP